LIIDVQSGRVLPPTQHSADDSVSLWVCACSFVKTVTLYHLRYHQEMFTRERDGQSSNKFEYGCIPMDALWHTVGDLISLTF